MDSPLFDPDRIWPRRGAQTLLVLAALVALAALWGHAFGLPMLSSYGADFIPMAPATAIGIILLVMMLLTALRPSVGPRLGMAAVLVFVAVSLCGAAVWWSAFEGGHVNPDARWRDAMAEIGAHPLSKMSPFSGALFVLVGLASAGAVLGHARRSVDRLWLLLSVITGTLVAFAALLVVVSYFIDAPLFYDTTTLPIALTTAIAFLLLALGLVALAVMGTAGSGRWPARLGDVSVLSQLQLSLGGIVLAVLTFGYVVSLEKNVLWSQTQTLYAHPLSVMRAAGDLRGIAWRMHAVLEELGHVRRSADYLRMTEELAIADSLVTRPLVVVRTAYLGPRADTLALSAAWQRVRTARDALPPPDLAFGSGEPARQIVAAEGAQGALAVLDRIDVVTAYASQRAEQLYREAERRNIALDTTLVAVFVAVLLAAVVIGWRLTRQISDPVRELTAVAAQFGRGQLDARSGPSSANELGVLAATFNSMADTIQRDMRAATRLTGQLRHSQALLAAQNRELESFSYSVSHDLRAPLRTIDGFSRILLEDYEARLDAEGRDYLQRIRTGAQQMGQLIEDLLRLSRLSRAEMQRVPIELGAMAREIAAELQHEAPTRAVTWIIADVAHAEGDRHLLHIALVNLLGNAWKFTRTREQAQIEFGTYVDTGRQHYFVRDNGVGFDPRQVDRLFTPFQRLHPSSEFPGNGIGLATVQRVIRRHGGQIWADAAPGEGAMFTFTLDAADASDGQTVQQQGDA